MSRNEWHHLQPGDRVQGRLVLAVVIRDAHTHVVTVCVLAGCYNVIAAKAYETFKSRGICLPCTTARHFFGLVRAEESRQRLARMKRDAYKPFVPAHSLPKKPPGQ